MAGVVAARQMVSLSKQSKHVTALAGASLNKVSLALLKFLSWGLGAVRFIAKVFFPKDHFLFLLPIVYTLH